jgi:hypothetical protein
MRGGFRVSVFALAWAETSGAVTTKTNVTDSTNEKQYKNVLNNRRFIDLFSYIFNLTNSVCFANSIILYFDV